MIKSMMKKVLPKTLTTNTRHFLVNLKASRAEYADLDPNKKKVIIFLAPDYGNLGDIAIGYAQKRFLSTQFTGYELIEVPLSLTYSNTLSLKRKTNTDDIVTIIGGGNIGNLYQGIEDMRKYIISQFSGNKIILFPQTIDFTDDAQGRESLKETAKVYGRHKGLLILAREQKSYNLMQEVFPKNQVRLVPDIVLSLDESMRQDREDGKVIFCMRNDKELGISAQQRSRLVQFISKKYPKIEYRDTHIGDELLSPEEGLKELNSIWDAFRSASLVVTDRLHGMIFCAITGTPCIAINNSNGKVQGVYDLWVKRLDGVVLIQEFSEESLKNALKRVRNTSPKNTEELTDEFNAMRGSLRQHVDDED